MYILINGGANGIGKATAERLSKNGHHVKVFDKDEEALEKLPDRIEAISGDAADDERVKQVVENHDFEVLINSAGYYELGAIEDMSDEKVREIFDNTFFAQLNFCRHATPKLRQKNGRIINISSIMGRMSMRFYGPYAGSKYATEAATNALRKETYGEIDVILVEPGPIDTGFNQRAREALEKYVPESYHAKEYRKALESDGLKKVPVEQAADKVIEAVEAENPKTRYKVTTMAHVMPYVNSIVPDRILDRVNLLDKTLE